MDEQTAGPDGAPEPQQNRPQQPPPRTPVFNLPTALLATLILLAGIYAVQAAASAPFHAVWESGGDQWVPIKPTPTMADGIASVKPVRIREVMEAVRGSKGAVVAVSEDEILKSLRQCLGQGLFVEPTSASSGAALTRLISSGDIAAGETVAMVLTGSGLKATDKIASLVG